MHVQMNCLTHKLPRKSFPVINWLEKAEWILDGRSAHCYCTGNSPQVPDMENLKLIGKGKKRKTSKTSLDKHTEAPKEGVCTQRVRNQSPVAVLIEAGLGCSLRAIGTLKELFLFASSDGPKQWLWFVGEDPNSSFLPAPLTADWVEQSYAPDSDFCHIPVLPFLAVVALPRLNSSSTDGSVHPDQEPPNLQGTKVPLPRPFTSSWLQKWKMKSYTFLFPTPKVSFSSQTTSLFVCRGKVFSTVNKNLGSKTQVTATRKKSVSMHYYRFHDIPLATITTLSIYHLHLELCASNLFKTGFAFVP